MSFDVDMDEFVEMQKENRRLREQLEAAEESAERWKGWYEEAMLGSNPASEPKED